MPLGGFDLLKEDTRLIKCDETVYKVKVLPQRDFNDCLPCSVQEAHKQIEDVLRAMLYMDQRSVIFKPIHTTDFVVTTLKKGWKTCRSLNFFVNGKQLKACPYQYILKVDLKPLIDKTTFYAKRKSLEHVKNLDKSHDKSKNRKSEEVRTDPKQIIESYKNIQNKDDITANDTPLRNDGNVENDEEKEREILMEKIRKRERTKREEIRKKEEVEKLFTNVGVSNSPGNIKRRKLYRTEVYCDTPGSVNLNKFYNTRSTSKSRGNDRLTDVHVSDKISIPVKGKLGDIGNVTRSQQKQVDACTSEVRSRRNENTLTDTVNVSECERFIDSKTRHARLARSQIDSKTRHARLARSEIDKQSLEGNSLLGIRKTSGRRSVHYSEDESVSSQERELRSQSAKSSGADYTKTLQQNGSKLQQKTKSKGTPKFVSKKTPNTHSSKQRSWRSNKRLKTTKQLPIKTCVDRLTRSRTHSISSGSNTGSSKKNTLKERKNRSQTPVKSMSQKKPVENYSVKPVRRPILQNKPSVSPEKLRIKKSSRCARKESPPSTKESRRLRSMKTVTTKNQDNKTDSISQTSSSRSSSVTRGSDQSALTAVKYSLRSRSLSPQGKKRNNSGKLQRGKGPQNSKDGIKKPSPKIDLFRPYQPSGKESDRLENLRYNSFSKKSKRVTRNQMDRHEVEKEEIEESMKLQTISKSDSPPSNLRRSPRKRKSNALWDFIDAFITPMKKVFKG
ncbi:micronuclear linker histone polyprotein-like isoform X1 [Mytilus edulis]|uniref:micronuclear linker histone polyprotein-like isoform X1 n=1 Tax=Mytilus edulis TaxID=6550 RepID=UPI0039F04D5A